MYKQQHLSMRDSIQIDDQIRPCARAGLWSGAEELICGINTVPDVFVKS